VLLLALDTTTRVCSAAIGDTERVWAEYLLNTDNTHSQRLMPLIISLLKDAGVHKSRLQGVAVCVGPGSFTGIRIGMATAKGLCQGLNIPVVGVMTLDALAEACIFHRGLICPVLNARKNQVYTALYRGGPEGPVMVEGAAAISVEELCCKLDAYHEEIIFLGDYPVNIGEILRAAFGERCWEMPYSSRLNRASLVLHRGARMWAENGSISTYAIKPFYIRIPEAERKLQKKSRGRMF
jgi:tRNA threonylcarbamoyladenosine biosynthesis protein TsaB